MLYNVVMPNAQMQACMMMNSGSPLCSFTKLCNPLIRISKKFRGAHYAFKRNEDTCDFEIGGPQGPQGPAQMQACMIVKNVLHVCLLLFVYFLRHI